MTYIGETSEYFEASEMKHLREYNQKEQSTIVYQHTREQHRGALGQLDIPHLIQSPKRHETTTNAQCMFS